MISLLSLYLAARNVSLEAVKAALLQADAGYVVLALIFLGVNTAGKAFRWKALMGLSGRNVSLLKSLAGIEMGQMLNYLYPGRVGELSRAYMIGTQGPGKVFTLGTIGLEKFFDSLFYVFLFVLLLLSIPVPGWIGESIYATILVLSAASVAVFWTAYRREPVTALLGAFLDKLSQRFTLIARLKAAERMRNLFSSLEVMRHTRDVIIIVIWTALIWITSIFLTEMALLSMGIHLPLIASVLIVIVLQAGISIPSVPGKIGVFQYSCVLALGIFGIGQSLGFSFGILLHGLVMIPTVLLGLIFFLILGHPVQWNRSTRRIERGEG